MIKVVVMVTGLVMVAPLPSGNPTAVRILFPQTSGFADSLGNHVHPHQAKVKAGLSKTDLLPAGGAPFALSLRPAKPTGATITLNQWHSFPHLEPFSAGSPAQPDCLAGKPSGCKSGGKDLFAGEILLSDGWSSRPLSSCSDTVLPYGFTDQSKIGFRTLAADPTNATVASIPPQPIANTFAFELTVGDLADLDVELNGGKISLVKAKSSQCKKYDKNFPDCAIVWIVNGPAGGHVNCKNDPKNRLCQEDAHFEHLYRYLGTAPAEQFVPYVVETAICDPSLPYGGGNPPYGRCYGTGYP